MNTEKILAKRLLATLVASLRQYFAQEDFLELFPPQAVPHPGMEPHLHPFQLYSAYHKKPYPLYLASSPEFAMKEALALGLEKIYTLGHSFRDEPEGPHHRPQFLMLEWYRAPGLYSEIAADLEKILNQSSRALGQHAYYQKKIIVEKITVEELFLNYVGISLREIQETTAFKKFINSHHPKLLHDPNAAMEWEDYFFLLFLNLIEPELAKKDAILVYDYPLPIAALSLQHENFPHLCQRFELYIRGIEIANCYQELTSLDIQKKRWEIQRQQKLRLYQYDLPEPLVLFQALEKGLCHPSAGIAVGVERLLMGLAKITNPFWH